MERIDKFCRIPGHSEDIDHYFIHQEDTPTTYSGHAGEMIVVKSDHSGLEFGTVSGTGTGIVRKYPAPPTSDHYWHNLNDNRLYGYDESCGLWLTTNRIAYGFAKNTLNFKGAYVSYGETNQASTGPLVPHPARIVGIYGRNDLASPTRQIELHDFTTTIKTIGWPNKNLYWTEGLNVNAGAILKIKAKSSNNDRLDYPVIYIEIAYRYDPTWDGTLPDGNDLGA